MKTTFIILYIIFLVVLYIFIYKRLKYINNKHIDDTWCKYLKKRNNFILFFIAFLLIVLGVLSIIAIITLL